MSNRHEHVCPVAVAGALDSRVRRWLQNPEKILRPFVTEGKTVLEVGCGPGFFTVTLARLVGKTGRVIAADLQEGMLDIVRAKIAGTELAERVILHKCEETKIGATQPVDFVLLFYMVHEVPDARAFFAEIEKILKPGGLVLLVEPIGHVSKTVFAETVRLAVEAGLTHKPGPKLFLSRAVVMTKS